MRQLQILAYGRDLSEIEKIVQAMQVSSFWYSKADAVNSEKVIITVQVSNRSLGKLLDQLSEIKEVEVYFFPIGVIGLSPAEDKLQNQIADLEPRSPLEVFMQSMQSVDSWSTFLVFALAGAIVVWIAFYTNSIFLLLAAMLIAPFAEPAMNVAVATSTGDMALFRKNLFRYLAAILTTSLVATTLALIVQQNYLTELMVSISRISGVAFLLPMVAGVAGALNLVQPERTSLVSGSAAGVLIAASLAPPAGLLGIALYMGNWNVALSSAFLLALQLTGINLAGSLILRLYGLGSSLQRYKPGKKTSFVVLLTFTLLLFAALMFWQFSTPLRFERSGLGAKAAQVVRQIVKESEIAETVSLDVRFPQPEPGGSQTLLITGYIQPIGQLSFPADYIKNYMQTVISERLLQEYPNLQPLIDLVVVEHIPSP